ETLAVPDGLCGRDFWCCDQAGVVFALCALVVLTRDGAGDVPQRPPGVIVVLSVGQEELFTEFDDGFFEGLSGLIGRGRGRNGEVTGQVVQDEGASLAVFFRGETKRFSDVQNV